MKTLLVVPTHLYKSKYPSFLSITDFPVGFAYLASALRRAGHEVIGLNPNNDPGHENARQMLRSKFSASLRNARPDIICTGGLCTDYAFLRDTILLARELAPDTPIVLGGGVVTHDAEYIFRSLRPDFCLSGEGEEGLVQLAQALENGGKRYEAIPNLGYWEGQNARFTPAQFNYGDLEQRAFPDYEPFGIKDMLDQYSMAARYLYRYPRQKPRPMPIVTGRGCPFSCTFCVHRHGGKYRARKIEAVLEEIGQSYNKYEFNVLIILDELFAVNKSRLREFSEAILQARHDLGWDFNWTFQTHASASFDRETLSVARRAGCYFFSYGLESASPRILVSMNKRSKQSQIQQAIQEADQAQIGFGGNFIFGDVAETAETTGETMRFFRDYCRDIHIFFGWIRPYPGSQLFDRCLENKTIPDKLWFYEHIDEQTFNMTAGADWVWIPWFMVLGYFGNLFLWVRSVDAVSCEPVAELRENPVALAYRTSIYEIGAVCPFCGHKFFYREFLGRERLKQVFSISVALSALQRQVAMYKQSRGFVSLFFLGVRLVSVFHPMFRLLFYLRDKRNSLSPSVITGCPQCNKRVRIRVNHA